MYAAASVGFVASYTRNLSGWVRRLPLRSTSYARVTARSTSRYDRQTARLHVAECRSRPIRAILLMQMGLDDVAILRQSLGRNLHFRDAGNAAWFLLSSPRRLRQARHLAHQMTHFFASNLAPILQNHAINEVLETCIITGIITRMCCVGLGGASSYEVFHLSSPSPCRMPLVKQIVR